MVEDSLFDKACDEYDKGNYQEAFKIFLEASENGDRYSMERLAVMYGEGEGTESDVDKSINWDMKAIELGSVVSMGNLASTYKNIGNLVDAKKWLMKAIDAGDGDAALELAKIYASEESDTSVVKKYLDIVVNSDNVCESSVDEAKSLLKTLR